MEWAVKLSRAARWRGIIAHGSDRFQGMEGSGLMASNEY